MTTFVATVIAGVLAFVAGITWNPSSGVVEAQGYRQPVACDQSVAINTAAASTLEAVALTAGQRIHVCAWTFTGGGITAVTLVRGTGTNCATSPVVLTGAMELGDNTSLSHGSGAGVLIRLPIGSALCVTNGAALQLSGVITYAKG